MVTLNQFFLQGGEFFKAIAEHSKAVLKVIFLTKANEICRHDHSSKNRSNDAYRFFSVKMSVLIN